MLNHIGKEKEEDKEKKSDKVLWLNFFWEIFVFSKIKKNLTFEREKKSSFLRVCKKYIVQSSIHYYYN